MTKPNFTDFIQNSKRIQIKITQFRNFRRINEQTNRPNNHLTTHKCVPFINFLFYNILVICKIRCSINVKKTATSVISHTRPLHRKKKKKKKVDGHKQANTQPIQCSNEHEKNNSGNDRSQMKRFLMKDCGMFCGFSSLICMFNVNYECICLCECVQCVHSRLHTPHK